MADLDLENLTPEQLVDAEPGIVIALKILEAELKDAEAKLIGNRAKDYSEYLQRFHRVEAYAGAISHLNHLKSKRKDILNERDRA